MTSGDDLVGALAMVKKTEGRGFDVVDVLTAPGFKIGRDTERAVVLLTPADPTPEPPTQLRRLSLDPRISLVVTRADGTSEEGEHGLIRLGLGEAEYLDAFLHVVANLIRVIGPSPKPGEVSIAMRRLVHLFDPNPALRGSVLGLWGELLVVCGASNAHEMLDSWHATVDAKFDFSAQGSRLEVKTTTHLARKHIFSLEQLQPVQGATVAIASIMTTETQSGTSVSDLIARAEVLFIDDASRQMRIHEVVAQTLGEEWARHVDRRFDEAQAHDTLTIFASGSIPKVAPVPAEVTGVSFTADCSSLGAETGPRGLAALIAPPGGHG